MESEAGLSLKISELVAIHEFHTTLESHRDILGDGFLMQFNPIYRNVMSHAIQNHGQLTEAWVEYLLMPLVQLRSIVGAKKIPYVPSARLLRDLEKMRAHVLTVDDVQIPESYHLHEAAHVIAESCFAGRTLTESHEQILKAIVCESFANTVDLLACAAAENERHELFLRHNCYMRPNRRYVALINRMNRTLGLRLTFMLTMLAYLHSNFLRDTLPAFAIADLGRRYGPEVKLTEKQLKDCEALRKITQRLDPQFRVVTTKMYLNLEGHDGDVFELTDFPFMAVFDGHPAFSKATEAMGDVILGSWPKQ